jgi:hypothetical protein
VYNVDWGDISVRRISPELYEEDPQAARDIYRQLKLALDKQENYIDARKFYALELQAHGRELEMELAEVARRSSIYRIMRGIWFYVCNLVIPQSLQRMCIIPHEYVILPIYGFLMLLGLISIPPLFGIVVEILRAVLYEGFVLRSVVSSPVATAAAIVLPIITIDVLILLHIRKLTGSFSRNPLNDILVYRLYGITANFGLSWVRPLLWLFITFGIYYVLWAVDFGLQKHLRWLAPILAPYESIAHIFPPLNGLTASGRVSPAAAFLLYTLIAYFLYQTILALRRRVRR